MSQDIDLIFHGLNDRQAEAVRAVQGPVLVISGPGSGKTRCLTHRIAYMIASGMAPEKMLAVTFTNKAAGEMRDRIQKLLSPRPSADSGRFAVLPQIGTFHALGLRILRHEIEKLGYGPNFVILDSDDQAALVKRIMSDLGIDVKKFNPSAVLSHISKLKTDLVWPENYNPSSFFPSLVSRVYRHYQSELQKMNAVDFDDLIGLPIKIFRLYPEALEKYRNRWDYILVDEYQDTSHDQYTLIGMLAAAHRNLFCIGDDAQSIYMFREADIRNILNFQKDYPDGKIIMLEQNYRSTKNILAAAQSVITNNKQQIAKELWTNNPAGDSIIAREAMDERDEADFVVNSILQMPGHSLNDFTVLYRTHAQSRAIEEALISNGVPYQIVGGIKFYARREIKDLLAYLRFLANPKDVISFERIFNVPSRGIGPITLNRIMQSGQDNLILATRAAADSGSPKQSRTLADLANLLEDLSRSRTNQALTGTIKYIIKKTGYRNYLRAIYANRLDDADERLENIAELLTVAAKYDAMGSDALDKFLEDITLLQDADPPSLKASEGHGPPSLKKQRDKLQKDAGYRVTLMTMHSSKGLEFPIVFMVGMEEGLFPHARTLFDPHELEEERRLCYVALTRAKERVIATFTRFRRIFGSTQANIPSRFLGEMPQNLISYEFLDMDDDAIEY